MAQVAMDEALYDLSERLPYQINLKYERRESIMNLLNGRDVLTVLPTGFWKSLIFQMFVISKSKLSLHNTRNNDRPTSSSWLVICPLESIIEDQIVEAKSAGISASSLTDLTPDELSNNPPQIMFASAETVHDSYFLAVLKDPNSTLHISISRLVVDESHTVER